MWHRKTAKNVLSENMQTRKHKVYVKVHKELQLEHIQQTDMCSLSFSKTVCILTTRCAHSICQVQSKCITYTVWQQLVYLWYMFDWTQGRHVKRHVNDRSKDMNSFYMSRLKVTEASRQQFSCLIQDVNECGSQH